MKLADWLKGNETTIPPRQPMTQVEFARRIGASPTLITAYLDGSVWPGRDKMEAIVRETGGDVTANDFLSAPTFDAPVPAAAGAAQ